MAPRAWRSSNPSQTFVVIARRQPNNLFNLILSHTKGKPGITAGTDRVFFEKNVNENANYDCQRSKEKPKLPHENLTTHPSKLFFAASVPRVQARPRCQRQLQLFSPRLGCLFSY